MLVSYIVITILFFALGASIASFLCVVAERSTRGETIMGNSHCACGRPLKRSENIPVIGYLKIGGRAKCCGAVLPRRYLYAEIILGVIYGSSFTFAFIAYEEKAFIAAAVLSIIASVILLGALKNISKKERKSQVAV